MGEFDEYRSHGLAGEMGCGDRPGVLVIDFIRGFTDTESPLASDLDTEVEATRSLLNAARHVSAPIFMTTTSYSSDLADAGLFPRKVPSLSILEEGSKWVELDPRLERQGHESLLVKKYASAFFGTPLASWLAAARLDTLFIAGCTTSGCVRASVVDAMQSGFRPLVVEECVGDRSAAAHEANLFDIQGKYGDVISLERAVGMLDTRAQGRQ